MYQVHVSNSFLQAPTLSSALYLLILRFFYRAYEDVSLLSSSVATDTELTPEEAQIFTHLKSTMSDFHPDAHACRARIALVVMDSPMICPWNIRADAAKYISKLYHVSARCRLAFEHESQLLDMCHIISKKEEIVRLVSLNAIISFFFPFLVHLTQFSFHIAAKSSSSMTGSSWRSLSGEFYALTCSTFFFSFVLFLTCLYFHFNPHLPQPG